MKIYHNIPDNKNLFKNPVVTIGNFDGVHLGHIKIFSTMLDIAKKKSGDPLVITFSAHPRKILSPEINIKILTTTEEKVNAIFRLGITNIILLHFTREMADMTAYDFYNDVLLTRLDIKDLVIGYDHAFGKNREGNLDFLSRIAARTGIGITRVEEELFESRPVSSTWLRSEIEKGDMATAAELMGRNYSIKGTVVKGVGRGRNLGFPTANIQADSPDKILPRDGVYAVIVILDDRSRYGGMMNIGKNPTFSGQERSLEVNVFEFNGDLYDREITVEFLARIRDEKKFGSADELAGQMRLDMLTAQNIISCNA
ncbi:MAG: bifunctional riboflavin kinase/FAD synthetase [Spirochaetes bacterium]|jgi:riboflavin kinase/FMN adenylyltransferase|nr:bifunctional riboflavin kinase/FAD synthetase [Spirochaetota bacterium]